MSLNQHTPPHTYPPGFPAGIIREYGMRYRLLYKVKHGIPLPPGKNLYSYFRLDLIERSAEGLRVTQKAEELYFTPQSFCENIDEPTTIQAEASPSHEGRNQSNQAGAWPFSG